MCPLALRARAFVFNMFNLKIGLILLLLVVGAVCFVYGVKIIYGKKISPYFYFIVAAVGCFTMGKLYELVTYCLMGVLPNGFNIGYLSCFGCMLFLFTANYGTVATFIDDGGLEFAKYRLLSLPAPFIVPIIHVSFYHIIPIKNSIFILLATIPGIFAAYYHFKHIIFPDMGFPFVKAIKGCNFVSLFFIYAYTVYMYANITDNILLYLFTSVILAGLTVGLVKSCKKGEELWKT